MCEETKKERISWIIPAIIILLVLISGWATWFWLADVDKRGTFGDMFGVTNAFFSGLAFGGVIYAILLQRKELELQRKELKDTREVLKDQKQQLEAQNTTLKKQNFESTFFQLLRLHNETTNSVEVKEGTQPIKGKKCFNLLFNQFSSIYGSFNQEVSDEKDKINQAYNDYYGKRQHEIGHYYRTMYEIIKFIESSDVENVELYVNLIRVQLTARELLLLFYHSLSDIDREGLKPLIEKYALLKSLAKVNLLRKEHESFYKDSAY